MRKTLLPFSRIPQLAKTDLAYASGDPALRPFYRHLPALDSFDTIIREKSSMPVPRADLVAVLRDQYAALPEQTAVTVNIEALIGEDTFTVTTAHQPALLLGPLYFLYKALSTINLAEAVQDRTGRRIIPVFVLGSEDHDLEELNHIQLYNKRLEWQPAASGPVGAMPAASLAPVLNELRAILGDSEAALTGFARVEKAYTAASTFAEATQALLHDVLGRFGLVVLNMSDARLKRHFVPVMKAELVEMASFRLVGQTLSAIQQAGFKVQAAPREINLFYLSPGSRERIVFADGAYQVLNSDTIFSEETILAELEKHPERFSPNVVLRPLYQEMILPNLAYVGGGGELAYWLERKALFEGFNVPFPMLVRRHSVLWIDRDAGKKMRKLGLSADQLFYDTDSLIRQYVTTNAAAGVELAPEIADLQGVFERLAHKAAAIDPTLENAVRADAVKAASALEQWQSRLVRAEKQKHEVSINQIRTIREKLFPGGSLQERHDNFLPYLLKNGETFLDTLKAQLIPFDPGFLILEEE